MLVPAQVTKFSPNIHIEQLSLPCCITHSHGTMPAIKKTFPQVLYQGDGEHLQYMLDGVAICRQHTSIMYGTQLELSMPNSPILV
jgi:hypothetical protein